MGCKSWVQGWGRREDRVRVAHAGCGGVGWGGVGWGGVRSSLLGQPLPPPAAPPICSSRYSPLSPACPSPSPHALLVNSVVTSHHHHHPNSLVTSYTTTATDESRM